MNYLTRLLTFSKTHGLKDHLSNYLKVIFFWCPLVSVLFIFGFQGHDELLMRFAESMVISIAVSSSCFAGSYAFNTIYNAYRRRRGLGPKVEGFFWGMLTSYPFMIPGLYLGFILDGIFSRALGYPWESPKFGAYSSGIIFGLMVSVAFTLFEVIRDAKEAKQLAELKLRALENEKLKAQVSALSAQMNPHLLFNSLNTIASTIVTDPRSAEDMIVQLSELYRGILKSAKGDMHSLESELHLCRSYLEIEQKRFGTRVQYEIHMMKDIDPQKMHIPVLLLQPLVENAVKHGLTPQKEGGRIRIEIARDENYFIMKIADNGIGPTGVNSSAGTGTGLSNCQSRVNLKYGENSKFTFARTGHETRAEIFIPWAESFRA